MRKAMLSILMAGWVATSSPAVDSSDKEPFQPSWESLKAHKDPEWFRDAKFGIYTHWGPVTLGAEDADRGSVQWYGMAMYKPDDAAFEYHRQRFGEQNRTGYKDIIPLFRAEKFNAEAWADLFAASGAKFAGPVAVHHDNFAMWDSKVTRWNSAAMGPKRDITGELEKALRARGLKFIMTFHHGFAWRYYEPAMKYDGENPELADLYGGPHDPKDPPSRRFLDQWLAMVEEPLTKYRPDLIWFDFELYKVITPEYQQRMFASVYNWAARNGREIGVAHKHREIHRYTGILDFERGREDKLVPYPWLTDTSVGPWFHQKSVAYKSVDQLVDVLVDIVSKNGCMLLNVGPQSDGAIPAQAQALLLGIGDWLKLNGEAIYGTRPWTVYGEGPTQMKAGGGFSEKKDQPYTARDIRFTTRGKTLYAIVLAWPGDGATVTVGSLAKGKGPAEIRTVRLLGHDGPVNFSRDAEGLKLKMPEKPPCDCAVVLKISGEE